MKIVYLIFTYLIHPFVPLFLFIRVKKNKEDQFRYKEKLGITKIKNIKNVIWFHAASLGEIKSISPLIKYYQNDNSLTLLVTSVTQSSYEYFEQNLKTKNTFHQYAPLDTPFIVKKFLNNWKPKLSIFTESEIWPNLIEQSSKVSKLILLNCRLSKNSFNKWKIFKKTFNKIISLFDGITAQNNETIKFLNFFGFEKVNYFGNLKFIQDEKNSKKIIKIKNSKTSWAAMSVHFEELDHILNTHNELLIDFKPLITFLIPRHLNRINEIEKKITNFKINYKKLSDDYLPENFSGIVIIDQFGVADNIFEIVNCVFMGGSFIEHGGQNPIEPLKYGCNILFGEYIFNFTEIYNELQQKGFAEFVDDPQYLKEKVKKNIYKKKDSKEYLKILAENIMKKNINFLNSYIY